MRCKRARSLWVRKVSEGISPQQEKVLDDHLKACPACGRMETELEETWNALGSSPGIEPSADFLPRLRVKLQAEQSQPRPEQRRRLSLKWQWAALAACALLAAVLLTRNGQFRHEALPSSQGVKIATDSDHSDEQLLQDIERALQSADTDYLSTYDSWPDVARQSPGSETFKGNPANRTKRKETS